MTNILKLNNIDVASISELNSIALSDISNIYGISVSTPPYAFNLDLATFTDTVTGQSLSCNIDGTRYDEVDGVTTAFETDTPTIADNGLRICGAYSNYLLNSGTPATQSLTLAAGSYTLWIEGDGSVTYNSNEATEGTPATFTLVSSTTADVTVSGDVDIAMVSKTKYPAPYIPTTTDPVSSPSEAGNSSTGTGIWIDDVATNFPLLYQSLHGKVESGVRV